MLRRCLEGSRQFALMLFQDPDDIQSLVGHVGVIVSISQDASLPDGRFNIMLLVRHGI